MISRRQARRRVLLTLGATAVLGVLAMPLARLFGEPYPWLIMPGFHGSGGFDGRTVRMVEPVFTFHLADRGARGLSAPQLFSDVNSAYVRKLASRFEPPPTSPPRFEHLLPAGLFRGFGHARRHPLDPHDPELFAWFVGRLRAHYPDAEPVAVTVTLRERVVDEHGELALRDLPTPPRRFSP